MAETPIDKLPVPDNVVSKTAMPSLARRATAAIRDAGHRALDVSKEAGAKLSATAGAAGERISETATVMADLNGDGKVDQEDGRIAVGKARDVATKTAAEVGELGKDVLRNDMVKDAAAGAAIGAVVAIPLPFIGPAIGASVGAIAGVIKNIVTSTKRK